jgi:hypothetical protein
MNITHRTAIILEILAGALGGFLTGVLAAFVGRALLAPQASGFGDLVGVVLGSIAGYLIGVVAGVVLAGRLLGQPGSPWRAALGSLAGAVVAALLAALLGLNQSPEVLQGVFVALPPIVAALAFNWRRRER